MKAKEFTPADKPRNFVAKNAIKTTSGAGAHKDKKRADKQGDVKHKAKQFEQDVSEGSDFGEPREILEDVLQTLEREVEWPLTEVMDPREVRQLLAPIIRAVNSKLISMDRDGNQ